eukprot:TRINITY_DN22098_c0_g1_i1.p1 TRINITY_DN22098_c0_g1~~TRINITY_DN22098_c0_g1_i1.p1  ORF type:complete len:485 (+),score=116.67 TRINITY_DN22098_c0_g1_i1:98-1456(+)
MPQGGGDLAYSPVPRPATRGTRTTPEPAPGVSPASSAGRPMPAAPRLPPLLHPRTPADGSQQLGVAVAESRGGAAMRPSARHSTCGSASSPATCSPAHDGSGPPQPCGSPPPQLRQRPSRTRAALVAEKRRRAGCAVLLLGAMGLGSVLWGWEAVRDAAGAHPRPVSSGSAPQLQSATPPPPSRGPLPAHPTVLLSREPRTLVADDFLTPTEAAEWAGLLDATQFGSTALVSKTGDAVLAGGTVSSQIATLMVHGRPEREQHMLRELERRIAEVSGIPVENGEPLRALLYHPGQYFRGHLDSHAYDGRPTTTRIATALVFVDDVPPEALGATYFPIARPLPREEVRAAGFTEDVWTLDKRCLRYAGKDPDAQTAKVRDSYEDGAAMLANSTQKPGPGMMVRAKRGRLLLWWDRLPNGAVDLLSRHAGCPLLSGHKRTLTKWLHSKRFPAAIR